MAAESKKFKVKDSDTVYSLIEVPHNQYEIVWTNSSGEGRSDLKDRSWVNQQFNKGEWYYLDGKPQEASYTGGSSNYYKVFVKTPTTLEAPYEAECNDIIEALKMTFAEGNAFKAIWRKAKARQGVQKKGYDNGLYDSEKVVFFGERMVVEAKNETI